MNELGGGEAVVQLDEVQVVGADPGLLVAVAAAFRVSFPNRVRCRRSATTAWAWVLRDLHA